MRSNVRSQVNWTGHKKMEELLDDPLAESLYGLFLQVQDSPRHLAFSAENLINEVYYISSECYHDDHPDHHLKDYAREVESDLGWSYAIDLVMPMVHAVISAQKRVPSKLNPLLVELEKQYQRSSYWSICQQIATKTDRQKKRSRYDGCAPIIIINKVDQLNAILGNNPHIER